ncbi:hypothetical protein [Kamptonema formosum]|uniref:hypothetical protein n=1 Tax=Kamptonema formosum TaxID=331992 RepID=UPI000374CC88|nr:hypothetical protein [Oscillatoria sp. PCC 10802]
MPAYKVPAYKVPADKVAGCRREGDRSSLTNLKKCHRRRSWFMKGTAKTRLFAKGRGENVCNIFSEMVDRAGSLSYLSIMGECAGI